MIRNCKDWANKLVGNLWAYRMTFKTPLGMFPFRVVFGKSCHFPVELEHRAIQAIKTFNFDLEVARAERRLQLSELEEIIVMVSENCRMHNERAKLFHNKHIHRKELYRSPKVFLYDSRLYPFLDKLRPHWTGPFIISHVFPHGDIEIQDPKRGTRFKVNG